MFAGSYCRYFEATPLTFLLSHWFCLVFVRTAVAAFQYDVLSSLYFEVLSYYLSVSLNVSHLNFFKYTDSTNFGVLLSLSLTHSRALTHCQPFLVFPKRTQQLRFPPLTLSLSRTGLFPPPLPLSLLSHPPTCLSFSLSRLFSCHWPQSWTTFRSSTTTTTATLERR